MDPVSLFDQITTALQQQSGNLIPVRQILLTLALIVVVLLVRRGLRALLHRRELEAPILYRWSKIIDYTVTIVAIFLIGTVWVEGISSLATFLGLVTAGIAIALRDPLTNLAAWAYILWRRPFGLSDRVEVDSVRGDVADIGPFTFTLAEVGAGLGAEQLTGRIILVPNSFIFSRRLANASQGFEFLWNEVPVVVTFESDWEKAKQILSDIAADYCTVLVPKAEAQFQRAMARFMIAGGSLTPRVYTNVVDVGVELTLRYIVEVRSQRALKEKIWEEILRAFAEAPDIDLAYPTQRIFYNPREGKPEAGGPKPERQTEEGNNLEQVVK